jgi:hypothetical protein
MTSCWQLVWVFAVEVMEIFRDNVVSLYLPRRARKLNVDDLGDCGGDLRGARGELGIWETRKMVGNCPWALSTRYYW